MSKNIRTLIPLGQEEERSVCISGSTVCILKSFSCEPTSVSKHPLWFQGWLLILTAQANFVHKTIMEKEDSFVENKKKLKRELNTLRCHSL